MLAGLLLGLAALSRHDLAVMGALPLFVATLRESRERAARLVLAALVPVAIFVLALLQARALGPAWECLVTIPSTEYASLRRLPFVPPWQGAHEDWPSVFSIYAGLVVGGLALLRAAWDRWPREGVTAAALPVVLFGIALVRTAQPQATPSRIAAFVALAALLRRPLDAKRKLLAVLAVAVVLPTAVREIARTRVYLHGIIEGRFVESPPRRGLLAEFELEPARRRALDEVAKRPPGSRIFVGLVRHDKVWANDAGFYFDAGALPATRHHEMEPRAARAPIQEEIVRELERGATPCVVLVSVANPGEPNESSVATGVTVLDTYLATRYSMAFSEGPYIVLRRR